MTRFIPGRLRWPRFASRVRMPVWVGGAALGIVLVGVAWIVITGLIARSRLDAVKNDIHALRQAIETGDTARAHSLEAEIRAKAHSAHSLTSGPAWWTGANIPGLGAPLQTSREIATQTDRLGTDVLPGVLRLADDLLDRSASQGATIDLTPLRDAQPALDRAARTAHSAARTIEDTGSSWLPFVSSARKSMVKQLQGLDSDLSGATRALRVVLPMLGQNGTQRYFIGFLNEAESRGLGGIPGAFAIVTADHGEITFTHFGSDEELRGVRADVHLGTDFNARYKQDDPAGVFPNSDLSPDFRDSARIWVGMWEKKSGQHLDGALAVDPTALSYLLKVTGPASLADGSKIRAQTVVALTQQRQYELYGSATPRDKAERKRYLSTLAQAIAEQVTKGDDGVRTVRALSRAAGERRLVVWSAKPALERLIITGKWAGVLDSTGAPVSGFIVNNAAGSKLDYYLRRRMTYRRVDCGPGGHSVATLTLINKAPKSGLPAYVTVRGDQAPARSRPGDNRLLVTFYATPGAAIQSITLDDVPQIVATVTEKRLVTATVDVELPIGKPRILHIVVAEPEATGPAQILRQPLVHPIAVAAKDECG